MYLDGYAKEEIAAVLGWTSPRPETCFTGAWPDLREALARSGVAARGDAMSDEELRRAISAGRPAVGIATDTRRARRLGSRRGQRGGTSRAARSRARPNRPPPATSSCSAPSPPRKGARRDRAPALGGPLTLRLPCSWPWRGTAAEANSAHDTVRAPAANGGSMLVEPKDSASLAPGAITFTWRLPRAQLPTDSSG